MAAPREVPATIDSGGTTHSRELSDAREQAVATEEILVALGRAGANSGEILDRIIQRAASLCGAEAAQLNLADGDVFRLSRLSTSVPEEFRRHFQDHPATRDRASIIGRVAAERRTQQIIDVLADPDYGRQDLQRIAGFRTLLSAPMVLDDDVVGVLSVWRTEVRPFDGREMELLSVFAAQAAIVLRQFDLRHTLERSSAELARKVEQLEALREVGEAVSSSLDPGEVLDRIVTNAVRLTDTDGGSIMEYDEQDDVFIVRAAYGSSPELVAHLRAITIRRDSTLVGRAATLDQPLQIADLSSAERDPHLDALHQDGWRSALVVPMVRGDVIVGVLVIRRRSVGPFPADMVELLETFASQSSVALINARLFRELQTKSAELAVASRHKSEFLASMSHELRTPLNAVIGFSEVLLDRLFGELNDRQDEYIHDIWNSGRHLLELLNEILDLSKVEAGQMVLEPVRFSVVAALEYALSLVRDRAAQHGIGVGLEVDPGIDTIEADELRFKQVVLNLVSNAVKFTPDGGRVDVRASRDDHELAVTVTDTGTGIPEADRERIFESFQQGGRGVTREEGTGLGLTLSRRIVELFGGRLWLESAVGVGSTFGFSLPVGPASAPVQPPAAAGSTSHPTVLLVDDDRASLDLVSAYLEGAPARLEFARDGVEALRMAEELRPAAVVLDIRLPGLDGWQVLAALRRHPTTRDIPVVVATVVDDRARGATLGADAYLLKPIGREELISALVRVGAWPASLAETRELS